MNEAQATRLLDLGLTWVGHWDAAKQPAGAWRRTYPMVTGLGLAPRAGDQAAQQALWGQTTSGAVARQVTTDLFTGVLTIAIPLPEGGWLVGAVEQQLVQGEAAVLADALEVAVRKEFGPNWAPFIAVGIAAAIVLVLFVSFRKLPTA